MGKFWKVDGGYAVMNPLDAHPGVCGVTATASLPFYESVDDGETWRRVGTWHWLERFGNWAPSPDWEDVWESDDED